MSEPGQRMTPQFSLQTLLWAMVVLWSSMAVFGAWGAVWVGGSVGLTLICLWLPEVAQRWAWRTLLCSVSTQMAQSGG